MKFFLDANMPFSSLEVFKKFGFESAHARSIGLGKADDNEIIRYAVKNKSVLVTKDIGFGNSRIFPKNSHEGVLVLRLPSFFKASQINNILNDFLNSLDINLIKNAVTIIKLGRYRIRR